MDSERLSILVLAAGKGTRMKSDMAKVLHPVFFAPMVHHVLAAVASLAAAQTIVVTGHQRQRVEAALHDHAVVCVEQKEQLGTGHAVLAAARELAAVGGTVMILCGDTPLVRPETLAGMLAVHRDSGGVLTVMTTTLANPTNYGRAVVDRAGHLVRIVEEKDASAEERRIREINAGIYCADAAFLLDALRRVGTDNKQGEMYLTDIVSIANEAGHAVGRYQCADAQEVLGVNSRVELAEANLALQERRNRELMLAGVTIVNPGTTSVAPAVTVGRDTIIHPHAQITGNAIIGNGCSIGPSVVVDGGRIDDGAEVGALSYLESCHIKAGERVPPHSVIRPG